jgi:bifunctional UDP-N-acetylglucosamine pyrophosphorylase/glucosamine-1-phosphate N-acetyltransferase
VLDTARSLSASRLCVIYGHGAAAVQALLAKQPQPVATALQEKQLGTGHAVMQGLPELDDNVPTLILYGDVPLTTAASLQALIAGRQRQAGHSDGGTGRSYRFGPHRA